MFVKAVRNCAEISGALRPGLNALGSNSAKIRPGDTELCEGSVNIDSHLQELYPHDGRWDYTLGYDGRTYFVEVHPATAGEVKVVVAKYKWLIWWLREHATALNDIKPKSYHWIPSGVMAIQRGSRYERQCTNIGIKIERRIMRLPIVK